MTKRGILLVKNKKEKVVQRKDKIKENLENWDFCWLNGVIEGCHGSNISQYMLK